MVSRAVQNRLQRRVLRSFGVGANMAATLAVMCLSQPLFAQDGTCEVLNAGVQICDLPERFNALGSDGQIGSWVNQQDDVLVTVAVDFDGFEAPVTEQAVIDYRGLEDDPTAVISSMVVADHPAYRVYQTRSNEAGITRHQLSAFIDIEGTSVGYVSVVSLSDFEIVQEDFNALVSAIVIESQP